MNKFINFFANKTNNQKAQSLLELVVGVGMVTVVVGAIAIVTLSSLRNTQYSKNQIQATKLAQQNMELVRSIKNSNYGVCLQADPTPQGSSCTAWEDMWTVNFGAYTNPSGCSTTPCTFNVLNSGCTVRTGASTTEVKPICLGYSATPLSGGLNLANLTSQIIIEDEVAGQKKVTSKAYWTDSTGQHNSNLVTIFSKY